MIISHQNKFIFIKTRKTAGTSIEIALSQFCGPKDVVWELAEKDELLRKELGYAKSRNWAAPFTSYKYKDWKIFLRQGKRKKLPYNRHTPAFEVKKFVGDGIWSSYYKFCFERNPFDRAISRYYWKTRDLTPRPDINEYIQTNTREMLSNWNKYTINDEVVVEFIGRYERLNDDLLVVSNRLGLPNLTLPHAKANTRTNHEHYSQVLNQMTRAHIEKICAPEIEYFGYRWAEL